MAKISFLSGAGNQTTLEGLSRAVTHMYKRNGVILPTDLAVSENDTPDTNVKIATGAIVIGFDGSYPEDAYYYGFADATELVAISANVSGNSRIDAVVAYVDTASPAADDNDGALVFTTVEGTPAGSPTAPSDNDIQTDLGAGVRWHRLANVTVANGFATITNANITDTRDRTFIESAKIGGTQTYADTISEFTAAAGVTADGVLLKDGEVITDTIKEATVGLGTAFPNGVVWSGWQPARVTFTYASATSLTINGVDVRSIFPPGTRIRLTQSTGGTKYFVVYTNAFSTNTTLNFIPTTSHTLENEAITTPLYAYDTPFDWPHWFNFDPDFTVSGGTVPTFTAISVNRWMTVGRRIDVELNNVNITGGTAGSGAQEFLSAPPIAIPSTVYNNANTRGFLGSAYASGIGLGMVRPRLSATAISFTSADGGTAVVGNSFTADQRYISARYSFGF